MIRGNVESLCVCVCVSFVCICRWKSRLAPVLWCWSLTLPEWVTHEFFSPFVDRISVLLCWFRPKLQSTLKVEQEWLAYEIGSEPQSWTTTHQLQSVATSCSPMASNYCQCRWMLRGHHIVGSFHEHQWERERGNVSKMQGLLRCKVRGLRIHKSNHSQETAHSLQGTTATYCNVGQRCPFIFVAAFPQSLCCSENHSGASFLPVNLYFALALKVFYRGWAWERKRSELRTQPALALNFDGAFPLEVCHRPSQA